MHESNRHLNRAVLEVVDNQIEGNDPPETRQTLNRLMSEGHSESEARELIGAVVAAELFEVMTKERPFDRQSFVAALEELPGMEFSSE